MEFKIVLNKLKEKMNKVISSEAWKKWFVYQIDEEQLKELKNEYRTKVMPIKFF